MDMDRFVSELKNAVETKERGRKLLEEKERRKSAELLQRKKWYKNVWESLQPVINDWEEIIIPYLNALGEQYWGKGNFMVCERINREEVSLELRNMCVSQTHENLEILLYVLNNKGLTGYERRFPIFGVTLMVELKPMSDQLPLFTHYLTVVDYVASKKCIKYPEQLQEALIESVTNGPSCRNMSTDWL